MNGLWRCPSIDVNMRSRDCHATDALRAISVWKLNMKTKWVCIQLACSWRPRAFEEAHHRNIQAKFYNEKFPLVYESDKIGDSLSWRSWCYFEAQVWKKDSSIAPSLIFCGLFLASLFFLFFLFFVRCLIPTCGGIMVSIILSSLGQCSNNDDHHTFIYLQLDTRTNMTLYECLWQCTRMCNDASITCMTMMNGGWATNTMSAIWSCKAIWQWWCGS